MEAIKTFETPINLYQTTRRNIPKDRHFQKEKILSSEMFSLLKNSMDRLTIYPSLLPTTVAIRLDSFSVVFLGQISVIMQSIFTNAQLGR